MLNYISPWIYTTKNCNLKCSYCYVKEELKYMEDETYEKMNSLFLKLVEDKEVEKVMYRISGGEPLLAFDKWKNHMKEFIDKSEGKGYLGLLTNLTIMNDEILCYILNNIDGLSVSLDGYYYSKPFKNTNSSANVVRNNIDLLIRNGYNNISVSTVVNNKSIDELDLLANFIVERDLEWGINLDHFYSGTEKSEDVVKKILEVLDILYKSGYNIYEKFKFNNIKIPLYYDGCTVGEKLIAIDCDGSIYPCQTCNDNKGLMNVADNLDLIHILENQKDYNIGRRYKLPEKCENCIIKDMCKGGCKLHHNDERICSMNKDIVMKMVEYSLNYLEGNVDDAKL